MWLSLIDLWSNIFYLLQLPQMKIVQQLLNFMESYDMAEANAKKICKELIERKFGKQPSSISKVITIAQKLAKPTKKQVGKYKKECEQCWKKFRTYFSDAKFCWRKCFGKHTTAKNLKNFF